MRTRPEWKGAGAILLYAPLPDELDVWSLFEEGLREGRIVALPRFEGKQGKYEAAVVRRPDEDLVRGRFGITEPSEICRSISLNRLDLVLVPGVGFDSCGRRLGRGKGYYDRLLPHVAGVRCGVAMDWQVLPALPAEPHDQNLDCILTPTRWLVFAGRAVRK